MPSPQRAVNAKSGGEGFFSRTGSLMALAYPERSRTLRRGFVAGLAVAVLLGVYLNSLWQPERQLRLHNQHLFQRLEARDWDRVAALISDRYNDQWSDDRTLLLHRLHDVFRLLRDPHLSVSEATISVARREGTWRGKVALHASGDFAETIEARVNSLPTPFALTWRLESGKPWDWKLVRVENPSLEAPAPNDLP